MCETIDVKVNGEEIKMREKTFTYSEVDEENEYQTIKKSLKTIKIRVHPKIALAH